MTNEYCIDGACIDAIAFENIFPTGINRPKHKILWNNNAYGDWPEIIVNDPLLEPTQDMMDDLLTHLDTIVSDKCGLDYS